MKGPRFWAGMTIMGSALFLLSFAFRPLDEDVGRRVVGARGFFLVAGGLGFLGAASFLLPVMALSAAVLVFLRRWWGALRLLSVTVLAEAASIGLKLVFARPRPEYMLVETGGYSFPSGHATLGAAVAMLLVWFAGRHAVGRAPVVALLAVALFWAVAMGASRLVLGVHYLSDVVGGVGLGIVCAGSVFLATMLVEERLASRSGQ